MHWHMSSRGRTRYLRHGSCTTPGSDGRGACRWWLLVRRAVQLRALLAASLAPLMHGTDDEMEQLKQVRTTRPRPTTAGSVHRPHWLPVLCLS